MNLKVAILASIALPLMFWFFLVSTVKGPEHFIISPVVEKQLGEKMAEKVAANGCSADVESYLINPKSHVWADHWCAQHYNHLKKGKTL